MNDDTATLNGKIELREDPNVTILVLREMNQYLREQLDSRRTWIEEALKQENDKAKKLAEESIALRNNNYRLKVALAQAIKECEFHNEQEHTTSIEELNAWQEWVDA